MNKIPAAAKPSTTATNDIPAPSWLGKMLIYLRGVLDVAEWQDLVLSLLEFESMDPPSGIGAHSLTFHIVYLSQLLVQKLPHQENQDFTYWHLSMLIAA